MKRVRDRNVFNGKLAWDSKMWQDGNRWEEFRSKKRDTYRSSSRRRIACNSRLDEIAEAAKKEKLKLNYGMNQNKKQRKNEGNWGYRTRNGCLEWRWEGKKKIWTRRIVGLRAVDSTLQRRTLMNHRTRESGRNNLSETLSLWLDSEKKTDWKSWATACQQPLGVMAHHHCLAVDWALWPLIGTAWRRSWSSTENPTQVRPPGQCPGVVTVKVLKYSAPIIWSRVNGSMLVYKLPTSSTPITELATDDTSAGTDV